MDNNNQTIVCLNNKTKTREVISSLKKSEQELMLISD